MAIRFTGDSILDILGCQDIPSEPIRLRRWLVKRGGMECDRPRQAGESRRDDESESVSGWRSESASAFFGIHIPCLLMTGNITLKTGSRCLLAFPRPPHGRLSSMARPTWTPVGVWACFSSRLWDPRYQRANLALTMSFWNATLRDHKAARAWLNGNGAKSALIESDR
jgi:hypothetical protein